MRTIPFLLAIAIMLTAISSEAQWQDRLYPFTELTDEMVALIDLKDGSIEDWLEVLGEPALTGLDFVGYPDDYDPSSYDCRLWLAWHEATDRLYIAAEIVDDIYVDIEKPSFGYYGDSTVWFFVDGDMSGGILFDRVSFFRTESYDAGTTLHRLCEDLRQRKQCRPENDKSRPGWISCPMPTVGETWSTASPSSPW